MSLPQPPLDRASIYVRLSREATDTNLSVEGMIADCRALAEREGLTVVAVHVDDGLSGAIRNRPALRAWLADIESCRAGVGISWAADRLTREGVNAAARILDVQEGKATEKQEGSEEGDAIRMPARLLTHDGLDSNDQETFRLRFVIQAEIARAERSRMVTRMNAAKRRLRAEGRWTGGAAPYGTRSVPGPTGGKVLEVDEDEAAWLHEVANRLLRGDSLRSTTLWLNAEGSTPRRASRWTPVSLKATLRAAAARRLVFTATEGAALLGVLPAVSTKRALKGQTLLMTRGLLICSGCSRALVSTGTQGKSMYACSTGSSGAPCARRVSVRANIADSVVEAEYLRRFGPVDQEVEDIILTSNADVDAAQAAYDDAMTRLTLDLTPEAFTQAQVAKEALQAALQAQPKREVVLRKTGLTMRQVWEACDVGERARYLRDALSGPVVLLPPIKRGRGNSEEMKRRVEARLLVPWRGNDPESQYADFLRDLARDAADYAS